MTSYKHHLLKSCINSLFHEQATTRTGETQDDKSLFCLIYLIAILLTCLVLNARYLTVGFANPILDRHEFRQTQTAISAYYALKDGPRFNYETPLLGGPWSIPMEFPLYQWITAGVADASNMSLDKAGRAVSIAFYYLTIVAVGALTLSMGLGIECCLMALCLFLLCPLLIFWSRTFMIESTSTFLAFSWLTSLALLTRRPRIWILGMAVFLGALAGAVKATTFAIAGVSIAIVCAIVFGEEMIAIKKRLFSRKHFGRWLIFCTACILPLIATYGWTYYADNIKSLNPLAKDFITSKALTEWNFGTMDFRFSSKLWSRIHNWSCIYGYGSDYMLLVVGVGLVRSWKRTKFVLASVGAFLAGPAIFANLFYMHDYYHYENIGFLLLAMAISLDGLTKWRLLRWPVLLFVFPLMLYVLHATYLSSYYPVQLSSRMPPLSADFLREALPPDDVLLIYDRDWSAEVPYYARHRALMNRGNLPVGNDKFEEAVRSTGQASITALIKSSPNQAIFDRFDFYPEPIMPTLYLRRDTRREVFARLFGIDVEASQVHTPLKVVRPDGKFRLMTDAPSELAAPLSRGISTVVYGVVPEACEQQTKSDGMEFVIELVKPDGTRNELHRQYLDPCTIAADRASFRFPVNTTVIGPGRLALRVEPGATEDFDWAWWAVEHEAIAGQP